MKFTKMHGAGNDYVSLVGLKAQPWAKAVAVNSAAGSDSTVLLDGRRAYYSGTDQRLATTAAGATVDQVVVYESRDVPVANEDVAQALADRKVDLTTVTSSAIARSLIKMFGDELHKTRLAAISPLTASVLGEHGFPPAIVAETYAADGLVNAVLAASAVKS